MSGGNLNHPPMSMTYASLVSCDSVHLAFLILTLNYLDILSCDIQNVYLNTLSKEEVFFYVSDEWKSVQGKVDNIVRALYGLKPSALA